MRRLDLGFLRHDRADLPGGVVGYLERTGIAPARPAYRGILKGPRDNVRDVVDFSTVLDISPEAIGR